MPLWLSVLVAEAKDLVGNDKRGGLNDTFCILKWADSTQQSRTAERSIHPQWLETIEFAVPLATTSAALEVSLWDKDAVSPGTHLFLGQCSVDAAAIEQAKKGAAIDKWFKLQRLKPTDLVRGELHLHLAFRDGPPRKTRSRRGEDQLTHVVSLNAALPSEKSEEGGLYVLGTDKATYQLRAATLPKILDDLLLDVRALDRELLGTFLFSFRSFLSPAELLKEVTKRYDTADNARSQFSRPLVSVFLRHWIARHWHDFEGELEHDLMEFVATDMLSTLSAGPALLNQIQKRQRKGPKKPRLNEALRPALCPDPNLRNLTEILDYPVQEAARQLTLLEHGILAGIQPAELQGQAWLRKNKENEAPHVLQAINRFNQVSGWVAAAVLSAPSPLRVALLEYFAKLAQELFSLRNYAGVLEVMAGLQSAPLFRLKNLWNAVPARVSKDFQDLRTTFTFDGNWKAARDLISVAGTQPCVPYLGIFLTDLVYLDECNPDYVENKKFINVEKMRKFASILEQIRLCQSLGFPFTALPNMQRCLTHLPTMPDSEMWSRSFEILPRTPSQQQTRNVLVAQSKPAAQEGLYAVATPPPKAPQWSAVSPSASAGRREEIGKVREGAALQDKSPRGETKQRAPHEIQFTDPAVRDTSVSGSADDDSGEESESDVISSQLWLEILRDTKGTMMRNQKLEKATFVPPASRPPPPPALSYDQPVMTRKIGGPPSTRPPSPPLSLPAQPRRPPPNRTSGQSGDSTQNSAASAPRTPSPSPMSVRKAGTGSAVQAQTRTQTPTKAASAQTHTQVVSPRPVQPPPTTVPKRAASPLPSAAAAAKPSSARAPSPQPKSRPSSHTVSGMPTRTGTKPLLAALPPPPAPSHNASSSAASAFAALHVAPRNPSPSRGAKSPPPPPQTTSPLTSPRGAQVIALPGSSPRTIQLKQHQADRPAAQTPKSLPLPVPINPIASPRPLSPPAQKRSQSPLPVRVVVVQRTPNQGASSPSRLRGLSLASLPPPPAPPPKR